MRTRIATVAVVAGVGASVLGGGIALAAVKAQSVTGQSVATSSWGITPQATTSTDAPTLTWSTLDQLTAADKYFRLTNTGAETVNATTFAVSVQRSNSSGQVPNLSFLACVGGVWNTSNGTCSGRTTPLTTTDGKNGVSVVTAVVPSAPGTSLSVRVTPTAAQSSYSYTAVISTTVTLAQTGAAATVSNS